MDTLEPAATNKLFSAKGIVVAHYECVITAPDEQKAEELFQAFGEMLAVGKIKITNTCVTHTVICEISPP